jgi:hypothetical protein
MRRSHALLLLRVVLPLVGTESTPTGTRSFWRMEGLSDE